MKEAAGEAFARVAADGIFALVVPIASLVIGDAVLGAEVRSGVFHFTWLTPTPLTQIVLGRWIGGTIVALVTIVPACALAALIAGDTEGVVPAVTASAFGAAAYIAVFIAIGCVARRAAVWSLAFVFLVERLLGTALTGIAQWSPTWESRAVFVDFSPGAPSSIVRDGIPVGGGAVVRLVLITVIALVIARWRPRASASPAPPTDALTVRPGHFSRFGSGQSGGGTARRVRRSRWPTRRGRGWRSRRRR